MVVNIRNSRSLYPVDKFQKLALLSVFSGVKYSLGINSDIFKYFTGLICKKSGCYAPSSRLSLFFPSPLALWVSRICSLRNLLKASSVTLQAPLVGTGGGTQRSRGMIGIQSSCRWFNLPKPAHQHIKSSRNIGELISNPVQLQVTWWVFTVLLSHNNSVASEAFLVIGNVHLALFTLRSL